MSEILFVTLCACICGAEGWQDIEDYGNAQIDFLRTVFPYKEGIPSDDTFRRFFRALDPHEFQKMFREWMAKLQPRFREEVIAIDGKCSRHTFDHDTDMLHMVSAYATESELVLCQEKVDTKSNEITAIPKLLEYLDLRGATVTIDAMGCQYEIAKKILEKEGQYILALKGNQEFLQEDVREFFEDPKLYAQDAGYTDFDKGHGRVETRKCWVVTQLDWLKKRHPHWRGIRSIIRIDSTRQIKDVTTQETRYYISSCIDSPQKALSKIRSHWAIENKLHWVLDMAFGEDQSRIRKHNAPQIMAIIRHIALNLLQLTKQSMPRQSIKRLRKIAGWNSSVLKQILSGDFS